MLTEPECWDRIYEIVSPVWEAKSRPNTATIEKLNTYVKAILIRRRVEALEE